MDILHKVGRSVIDLFARAGLAGVKFAAAVLIALGKALKFILHELLLVLKMTFRGVRWIFRGVTEAFRSRVGVTNELMKDIRSSRGKGFVPCLKAVVMFIGSFLFGEGGVVYTAFNYLVPIVAVTFLIAVIRYGSGFEYGLVVEYNGRELGIISSEADFEEAEREVEQRVSYAGDGKYFDMDAAPKYSLRIVSDSDKYVSPSQLANIMLESSDEELTTAYGIYIDGKFIGAVKSKNTIQDVLTERLLNYEVEGNVRDVSYVNKIEYSEGIYLRESLMSQKDAIDLLTSVKQKETVYIAQSDDSAAKICQKYNMELDSFYELNPAAEKGIRKGQMLTVTETESYLPIQYIRERETLSFIDYETIEVETSSLNLGVRSTLVKGVRGERLNTVEVTYVEGVERSSKVLSSRIVKQPVVEEIGIGTYTAMPDDPDTVFFGSPLTGSGFFGWPLNGGWVSDTFISNRNHKGLDIAAPEGTEIYAARDGVVTSAGWNDGGYGNVVMIDHMDGYTTIYGHMILTIAVEGQYVTKGQLIGYVGNTGYSFGNHCHFEVRYQNMCLNPADYLNTTDMKREE
ncbi:MAG: peptidoglycan DD-metalloendopeptidase family protein [Ruminococcus sp.]|nr:peptidoglycan DD-metalloendopeptidase family protein [Ruminococcus sp.]